MNWTKSLSIAVITLAVGGCATSSVDREELLARQAELDAQQAEMEARQAALTLTYPLREDVAVQVRFESTKAMDDVQMGLFILNKMLEDETVPDLDEEAFFPKYFSMVNTNIDNGLLYIDNEEAEYFSHRIYQAYQRKTLEPYLEKQKQAPRVLGGQK